MVDIIGTWVTSFNNWFQNEPTDLPQLFRIINNRIIGWRDPFEVNDRFDREYFPYSDDQESPLNYWTNPATQEFLAEYRFLQLMRPIPVATLSCFNFEDKNIFKLWVRFNNMEFMEDWPDVVGHYDFGWHDIGTYGGTITISSTSDPNGPVHATLAFLLMSSDEMKFIMAYKDNRMDRAPSGAGTMRRVKVPPPPPM